MGCTCLKAAPPPPPPLTLVPLKKNSHRMRTLDGAQVAPSATASPRGSPDPGGEPAGSATPSPLGHAAVATGKVYEVRCRRRPEPPPSVDAMTAEDDSSAGSLSPSAAAHLAPLSPPSSPSTTPSSTPSSGWQPSSRFSLVHPDEEDASSLALEDRDPDCILPFRRCNSTPRLNRHRHSGLHMPKVRKSSAIPSTSSQPPILPQRPDGLRQRDLAASTSRHLVRSASATAAPGSPKPLPVMPRPLTPHRPPPSPVRRTMSLVLAPQRRLWTLTARQEDPTDVTDGDPEPPSSPNSTANLLSPRFLDSLLQK
eukprot:EG_transcript_8324